MVTTVLPDGVTNAAIGSALQTLPFPDPTKYAIFMDDFFKYDAAASGTHDWKSTGVGTTPTAIITDANNGRLLITNAAADDNSYFTQWEGFNSADVAETFQFVAGKNLWFKTRFQVSDATQSDVIAGLYVTDTTPLDATDGVFFLKSDDGTTINFKVVKSSTATTQAVGTLVSATDVSLGFHYNGTTIIVYMNDVRVASVATTNLPTVTLALGFGIQNGEAVAKTMSMDYIFCANDRS